MWWISPQITDCVRFSLRKNVYLRLLRRLVIILSCLLLSWTLCAAEGHFVNYGSADGLPSNTVYAITQDAEGFLWVGTRNGLCRFDGTRFTAWKEFGRVTSLAMDKSEQLWIGTTEGLYVREIPGQARNDERETWKKGPSGHIRALLADSEGYVWATVGDTLLLKLSFRSGEGIREEARALYDKRYNEGDYPYFQIYEDNGGRLWLGGRIVHCQYVDDRKHPAPQYYFDENGCIGSYAEVGGILYAFSDYTNEFFLFNGPEYVILGHLPVAHASLLTDHKGQMWAAGSYGLGRVDVAHPEQTPVFRHDADNPFSLASTELYCIFEDRKGNLWVGGNNGLSVLCPALQQVHTVSAGQVTALMQDREGGLWIGTADKGVGRMDSFASLGMTAGSLGMTAKAQGITASSPVSCFYQDKEGAVYVGLWNNTGFEIWDNGKMRKGVVSGPLPREQEPAAYGDRRSSNWISDFLEDSRGRFWVVTWEGVGMNEWDRKTGKTLPPQWLSPFYQLTPQVDSNIYLSSRLGSRLMEDTAGNLVYGTTEAGLNIIDKETGLVTKYYRGNSDIPDDYVTDLCLAKDGTVWTATRSGLWSPSGGHGLDGLLVQSVEADREGRLWAGTEEGLYFIDTDGSVGRVGKSLGFPSDIYGEHVSCTLSDGSLAFGGSSGAAVFHPDSLLCLAASPEIFLTELSTTGASLQFSFSVKNLPHAALLQYRYRLSGVDADWIQAEFPRLQGRYNGLFPGRYTLEIQSTDLFGRWQEDILKHSFRIHPPLLLRWPFLLLYLLLLGLAAWLFVRYRENRQRALVLQEELDTRNRFFGIISHDLRNPVSGIQTLASALEDAPDDQLRDGVKAISAAAGHTSTLLENLLMWSVSQKGVLRPALRDVPLAAIVKEAVGTRRIQTAIPEGLTVHTDPHMLTTCIRNLLDNAVRFSPEEESVRLSADGRRIVIRDKGPGMDADTLKTLSRPGHLGLTITRELLEKMGASLSARNLPEGGCEVTIQLP